MSERLILDGAGGAGAPEPAGVLPVRLPVTLVGYRSGPPLRPRLMGVPASTPGAEHLAWLQVSSAGREAGQGIAGPLLASVAAAVAAAGLTLASGGGLVMAFLAYSLAGGTALAGLAALALRTPRTGRGVRGRDGRSGFGAFPRRLHHG